MSATKAPLSSSRLTAMSARKSSCLQSLIAHAPPVAELTTSACPIRELDKDRSTQGHTCKVLAQVSSVSTICHARRASRARILNIPGSSVLPLPLVALRPLGGSPNYCANPKHTCDVPLVGCPHRPHVVTWHHSPFPRLMRSRSQHVVRIDALQHYSHAAGDDCSRCLDSKLVAILKVLRLLANCRPQFLQLVR